MMLMPLYFQDPEGRPAPNNLQEAMASWTFHALDHVCQDLYIVASKAGLKGAKGRKGLTFRATREIFFPLKDMWAPPKSSPWYTFFHAGYMKTAYDLWITLSKPQQEELLSHLDDIFERLQCLPLSNKAKDGGKGCIWTLTVHSDVQVVANPTFYRVVAVGSSSRSNQQRRKNVVPPPWFVEAGIYHVQEGLPFETAKRLFDPKKQYKKRSRAKVQINSRNRAGQKRCHSISPDQEQDQRRPAKKRRQRSRSSSPSSPLSGQDQGHTRQYSHVLRSRNNNGQPRQLRKEASVEDTTRDSSSYEDSNADDES